MKPMLLVATAVAVVGGFGCKDSTGLSGQLDTSLHTSNASWDSVAITASVRWRLLHATAGQGGVVVTGSYDMTFDNHTGRDYTVGVSKLGLENGDGVALTQVTPTGTSQWVFSRYLVAGAYTETAGNFTVTLPSVHMANSITHMNIWASFW